MNLAHLSKDDKYAVAHLAASRGWELVQRHIEQRREMIARKILATQFTDLSDVKALQAEVAAYSRVLGFVNGLLGEVQRMNERGTS